MSVRKQSRKWNLTINDPIGKGWSHDKLRNTLQSIASMLYFCLGDEIGENETFHTHFYFVTKNCKPFTTVKNFFPEAHIESPNGTSQQNRDYVFKDGDKFHKDSETGNYDYTDSSGKRHIGTHYDSSNEEWGELPQESQGKRTDLATLYEMIKDGYTNVEIMEENPNYMLNLDKIERARQNYRESLFADTWRDLEVTYIWGPTGSGKTRLIMDKYGYSNVYRVSEYYHPFDSYRGQEVILFEEFRSSLRISDMLKYLDGYPVEFPARYMNKVACFTKVFFCTNIDLRYQYRDIQKDEPETWKAFLRRIKNVMIMVDGHSMTYPTEEYMNDEWFFLTDDEMKYVPFDLEYEQQALSISCAEHTNFSLN